MQTPPDRHTDDDIRAVAFGLVQLTDLTSAAAELARLYGRDRATAALLPLIGRTSATVIDLDADGVATTPATTPATTRPSAPPHRPVAADATRPGPLTVHLAARRPAMSGDPRRGTRPGDWL